MQQRKFVDDVIIEAALGFIPGSDYHVMMGKASLDHRHGNYHAKKHPHFSLDAAPIKETAFIAGVGPKKDISSFFNEIVYNAHYAIKQIIAMGTNLLLADRPAHYDFIDYCQGSREVIFTRGTYARYKVVIKQNKGKVDTCKDGQFIPKSVIESTVTVAVSVKDHQGNWLEYNNQKELTVTLLPVQDNSVIQLMTDEDKEIIWQIYKNTLPDLDDPTQYTYIHCSSGVGRTGHLILTLEILRHYETIFPDIQIKTEDAYEDYIQKATAKIHAIVARMREDRPALIFTQEQFTESIRNAERVWDYALQKGYIQAPAQPVSPLVSLNTFAEAQKKNTKNRWFDGGCCFKGLKF